MRQRLEVQIFPRLYNLYSLMRGVSEFRAKGDIALHPAYSNRPLHLDSVSIGRRILVCFDFKFNRAL